MTFFFTLRGILARTHDPHGFAEGGALWFPDLTVADPYYILPVVTGGTFFAMASVDLMGAGGPVRTLQRTPLLSAEPCNAPCNAPPAQARASTEPCPCASLDPVLVLLAPGTPNGP